MEGRAGGVMSESESGPAGCLCVTVAGPTDLGRPAAFFLRRPAQLAPAPAAARTLTRQLQADTPPDDRNGMSERPCVCVRVCVLEKGSL